MSASWPRRHPWWSLLAAALVLVLVAALVLWRATGEESTSEGQAPRGEAFYSPSAEQVAAGEHGSVIWSRRVVDGPTIGGSTHLVLYRSTSATGETVPVSGVISVPEGDPPEGGWPVVSWGHGTTGMADRCAPSRALVTGQTGVYSATMDELTTALLEDGYAVVRTDYEGLGTPGPHPYLMGQSSGAAMTDIVLAAREMLPDLSHRWVAMGHSQGGQAALFTSRFTDAYAPGLDLLGIAALAPPSQLGAVVEMTGQGAPTSAQEREAQEQAGEGASFLGPLVVAAARTAGVPVESVVSEEGRELLPHLEDRCITELFAQDSFGGTSVTDFVADGSALDRVRRTVGTNDAAELHPRVPVLLVQGAKDTTVPSLLSDRLADQYRERDVDLEYVTVPEADHVSMLPKGESRVRTWVDDRFDG